MLKLIKSNLVIIDEIIEDTRINKSQVISTLNYLEKNKLLVLNGKNIEISNYNKILLTVRAIELRADIESTTSLLHWKEFEEIAAFILERNNFIVKKNFRFTYLKKRNEIDLIGLKNPLILCIDCKHWHKELHFSSINTIVIKQIKRTKDLVAFLPSFSKNIECAQWDYGLFIPAILTLLPAKDKFHNSVPIIPILQFQDFINQLFGYLQKIKSFKKNFYHLP